MLLDAKQISASSLGLFVGTYVSGTFLSGALVAYLAASGWVGPNVLYITGVAPQTVNGSVVFAVSPSVPYSGGTGTVSSTQWTLDLVSARFTAFSGYATGTFVDLFTNQTIGGNKTLTGQTAVAWPTLSGSAVPFQYLALVSGLLQSGLNNVTVANSVTTTGNQAISGVKSFLQSPQVPTPVNSGDAVSKFYVDNVTPGANNLMNLTGDQISSGIKTFLQSPIVPVATTANQAVNLAQLNSIGNVMAPITGFAGVISINGTSGASGYIFLQGAGTVSVTQCGPIFYISGVALNSSQFYAARIPLPSGITGMTFLYGTGFNATPTVVGNIEYTGNGSLSQVGDILYGNNGAGFNVAFSTGIPSSGYVYAFESTPQASGGSGFITLQGQQGIQGLNVNVRGTFQIGQTYAPLDIVYAPSYSASFISNNTAVSTSLNAPGGTGNGQWALFMTGIQGATGFWTWRGNYATGTVYTNTNATFYNGSSYGFTGAGQASGFTPDALTGGWGLIAQQGLIGSINLQSGSYITGSFVNLSFFASPVSTGLDQAEAGLGHNVIMTGFQIKCRVSGAGPTSGSALLSGSIYTVGLTNNKTTIQSFTFNSGVFSYYSGGLSIGLTGGYSVGFDLTSTLSGLDKLSINVYGFSTG